jgi:hypothetical protein
VGSSGLNISKPEGDNLVLEHFVIKKAIFCKAKIKKSTSSSLHLEQITTTYKISFDEQAKLIELFNLTIRHFPKWISLVAGMF